MLYEYELSARTDVVLFIIIGYEHRQGDVFLHLVLAPFFILGTGYLVHWRSVPFNIKIFFGTKSSDFRTVNERNKR